MVANAASEERELVDGAIAALSKDLPATWQVRRSSRTVVGTGSDQQSLADDLIEIAAGPNGVTAALVVKAKRLFGPRDVERLSGDRLFRVLRLNYNLPVLVVS